MTYPLIGNYGICRDDMESLSPGRTAFIVRELSRVPSNFRSDMTIQQFLDENGVPGIAGIDTRALTRILREKGTMNGMITTNEDYCPRRYPSQINEIHHGQGGGEGNLSHKIYHSADHRLGTEWSLSGAARFDRAAYEREKRPALVKSLNGIGLKVALWIWEQNPIFPAPCPREAVRLRCTLP